MKVGAATACLAVAIATTVGAQERGSTLESALEQTRDLVEQHRYRDVVELLEPFDQLEDPEARYAVTAELGRAHFHLGAYETAHGFFEEAVRLRPQRVETALYLEATSYLTGRRDQAYRIFREVLQSGATDLHLAVTLPGERAFLADPEVRRIVGELSRSAEMSLDPGGVLGVELGESRGEVASELGIDPRSSGLETAITAHAGPYLTWAFTFDENDTLNGIMAHNEHLLRYTPYRLELERGVDWRAAPSTVTAAYGAPTSTTRSGDDVVVMVWDRKTVRMTLEFATPRTPRPPGIEGDGPILRVVRLEALVGNPDAEGVEQDP